MREIKFRYLVIRVSGHVFSRVFTLEQIEEGEVETWRKINHVDLAGFLDTVKKDQYTGLHDKNGKEIYEGDILEGKEEWWTPAFVFFHQKGNEMYWHLSKNIENPIEKATWNLWGGYTMKVIGNIYENPDLLGKKI